MSIVSNHIQEFVRMMYLDTGSGITSMELPSKTFNLLQAELHHMRNPATPFTGSNISELVLPTPIGRVVVRCADFSVRTTTLGTWATGPTELSGTAIQNRIMNCTHQWVDIGVMNPKLVCKLCDADK